MKFLSQGLVAQWIEHVATDHGVGGSNPSKPVFRDAVNLLGSAAFCLVHVHCPFTLGPEVSLLDSWLLIFCPLRWLN